jgi:hypothetical protein
MIPQFYDPGDITPRTGLYRTVWPDGRPAGDTYRLKTGRRIPPSNKPGQRFEFLRYVPPRNRRRRPRRPRSG